MGMSCAVCGDDPRLATSRNDGCGCSLAVAGMDVSDDADDVAFNELEGRHAWILASSTHRDKSS